MLDKSLLFELLFLGIFQKSCYVQKLLHLRSHTSHYKIRLHGTRGGSLRSDDSFGGSHIYKKFLLSSHVLQDNI